MTTAINPHKTYTFFVRETRRSDVTTEATRYMGSELDEIFTPADLATLMTGAVLHKPGRSYGVKVEWVWADILADRAFAAAS